MLLMSDSAASAKFAFTASQVVRLPPLLLSGRLVLGVSLSRLGVGRGVLGVSLVLLNVVLGASRVLLNVVLGVSLSLLLVLDRDLVVSR